MDPSVIHVWAKLSGQILKLTPIVPIMIMTSCM